MVAIFVVSVILAFILLDLVAERFRPFPSPQENLQGSIPSPLSFGLWAESLPLPSGLFFHPGHTWAHLLPSGEVKVGADMFAAKILGRIDHIQLPKVGEKREQGEGIFAVHQGERRVFFPAPLSGIITAVNPGLVGNTEALKRDPYQEGWVVAMKPVALAREIKDLVIAEEAARWLKKEVSRFVEFVTRHLAPDEILGATAADGGLVMEGLLERVDDDAWQRFQEAFLRRNLFTPEDAEAAEKAPWGTR